MKIKKTTETVFDEEETPKILGIKRNIFFGIVGVVTLLIALIVFNNIQQNDRLERMQQNQETEAQNEQLENQQKEIEEQKNRLAEQEKIEAERKEKERIEKERIEKLEKQFNEYNESLNSLYSDLGKAQRKLNDVTGFKLLRSSSERSEQIYTAQNDIDLIKENIKTIEDEMEKINSKLAVNR